jgi:hypothetical protein
VVDCGSLELCLRKEKHALCRYAPRVYIIDWTM